LYPWADVFGEVEGMTGAEDMMTGVKGTTGAEKEAEATKNIIRSEGGKGEHKTTYLPRVFSRSRLTCIVASAGALIL
jgi:hypothetical protein